VGTGTVLADNPHLTVRDSPVISKQPLRVVVGKRPIPEEAAILDGEAESLVLPTHDPIEVLAELAGRGIISVLLESGPTLAAAFWRAGCVDTVVAYLAPALLGSGRSVLGDIGIETIADAHRLEVADVTVLDGDVRVTAHVTQKES
jgi:diaminohydroxyphosphoribosylaminopyrimidine deaminase/5-amino-6-(5-phosphoribosylamino)uracil reductase